MALILDLFAQAVQMLLVLVVAPLLIGVTRKVKAHLLRRIGPSVLQPYRDLWKLLHKEAVVAHNASWIYRVAPYLIFAATWVAAALVPTYATGLIFSWSADLIAIIALLGAARFFLALAGMDVGTSFGGIGSSREVMIAALAEPAMLLVVFCMALVAGSTQLSTVANFDRIIVLQEGRIVEDGPPDELRRQRGLFDQMCRLQERGTVISGRVVKEPK